MWNAIRSDLMDFVSTIAEDTTKTYNTVIGEQIEEDEEVTLREKMTADLKRSFNTYGTAIEDQYQPQYEKFLKKFSLSSQAADIAELLDEEVDVSRYYAELVPGQVKPEEFWARYFFRLLLLSKEGSINLDEEDDEELLWETHEEKVTPSLTPRDDTEGNGENSDNCGSGGGGGGNGNKDGSKGNNENKESKDGSKEGKENKQRIIQLEEENFRLKGQVKILAGRVTELEKEISLRDSIPSPSPFNTVLPVKTVNIQKDQKDESKYGNRNAMSVPPNAKYLSKDSGNSGNEYSDVQSSDDFSTSYSSTSTVNSIGRGLVGLITPLITTGTPLTVVMPLVSPDTMGNSSNMVNSFKPINGNNSNNNNNGNSNSNSNTTNTSIRASTSSSATTLATESTNTGSVSPLTEVTEGFIRRAQRVSQNTSTLSNINMSSNVSVCTSEPEHTTFNNNDLHSETASEDSGVLVPVERTVLNSSSVRTKGDTGVVEMEMSSMNLISSFDNAVTDRQLEVPVPTQINTAGGANGAGGVGVGGSSVQETMLRMQREAVPVSVPVPIVTPVVRPVVIPVVVPVSVRVTVVVPVKASELAALDGDEEDDDGWS